MTQFEPNHSGIPVRQLRFDRYVLDLKRGHLLLDDTEITLRPKTFAVLRFLLENPGRLVSKDELFAAVWPKISVTDDVLVQSVGELRRALADDGQRLIKTIPRRGYRFESVVSAIPSADSAPRGDDPCLASTDEDRPTSTPSNKQTAPGSILRVGWRRPAVALGSAFLLLGVVLLTYRGGP